MEQELKSALATVQSAAAELEQARAAFESAQDRHASAIATAKAAHDTLTAFVATIIPGIGAPRREL